MGLLAVAIVLGSSFAAPAAIAATTSYTVRTGADGYVSAIGAFKVGRDPHLRKAILAFGEPDARYRAGGYTEGCTVRWDGLGLTMIFANFGGGGSACHRSYGKAQRLTIKGSEARRWRTAAGLRIGSRESRIPDLHPQASRHGNGWWLTTISVPYGPRCPCPEAGLRAKVTHGRVSSFRAWIGAAGD